VHNSSALFLSLSLQLSLLFFSWLVFLVKSFTEKFPSFMSKTTKLIILKFKSCHHMHDKR
jgi:hypothetical protein